MREIPERKVPLILWNLKSLVMCTADVFFDAAGLALVRVQLPVLQPAVGPEAPGPRPAEPSMRPSAEGTKGRLCGHTGRRAATSNNRPGPNQAPSRPLDVKQTCLFNNRRV